MRRARAPLARLDAPAREQCALRAHRVVPIDVAARRRPPQTRPFSASSQRHRSVIAFVAGHSHRNRITPYRAHGGGGFWEIVTSSHTDWPEQSRVIDLYDNRDGTLSITTHVIEHAAPPRPGQRRARPRPPAEPARGEAARLDRARALVQRPPGGERRGRLSRPPRHARSTAMSSCSCPILTESFRIENSLLTGVPFHLRP